MLGSSDEGVFEITALVAEYLIDAKLVFVCPFNNIIEHRIMPGMRFDNGPHRRDLMRIKDRLEIICPVELSRQNGGHTHEFVRDNDRRVLPVGRSDRFYRRKGGRCESDILLVFPKMFIKMTAYPVFVEHFGL